MNRQAFTVRIALGALLAGLIPACATTSSEEAQYERATGQRVQVSGSRIPRKVDPATREAVTEYPLETINNAAARAEFEALREAQMRQRPPTQPTR